MKGTQAFPQDPGSVLTLGSSILHSESLCISTSLDLKRMEFPIKISGIILLTMVIIKLILQICFFFLCKNSALEVLRKPFNHLKACLQALDLKRNLLPEFSFPVVGSILSNKLQAYG